MATARVGLLFWVAFSLLAVAGASARSTAPSDSARLSHLVEGLERELELASQDVFYLLLDPGRKELRLMHRGVSLWTYPIQRLEVGRPRLGGSATGVAPGSVWSEGTLVPGRPQVRLQITPPPPGEDPDSVLAVPIPPDIEEAVRVPPSYRISFRNLVVTVETPPGERPRASLGDRLRGLRLWFGDRFAAFDRGTDRLRLVLSRPDAMHLFRSLPGNVSFVVAGLEP
jgi:hypothetical protein